MGKTDLKLLENNKAWVVLQKYNNPNYFKHKDGLIKDLEITSTGPNDLHSVYHLEK